MVYHPVDYECDCGNVLKDEMKQRHLQKMIICICGKTMKPSIQQPGYRPDHLWD